MKNLLTVLQWLALVGVLAYIAWRALTPEATPERDVSRRHSWDGFYAISYKGVRQGDDSRHVSPKRLQEHLNALADAGYQTLGAADVANFLAGKSPLPRKSLVLIFEEGRKDALVNATAPLEEHRFTALLCVPTAQVRRRSVFANRGDLARAGNSPFWQLCSMGHMASQALAVDSEGGSGHFLARRRWLADATESDEEFRSRILEDYARGAGFLLEEGKAEALAYLYPYSDRGTGRSADPLAAQVNRDGVREHHRIAFARSGGAFNGPQSDPFDLTRLQVSGDWDGPRLLAELEAWAERRDPVVLGETQAIFTREGEAQISDEDVELVPDSVVWVRGSEVWSDQDVSADVELLSPESLASLYVRWSGPDSSLRLSLRSDAVRLQERLGTRLQTLALKSVSSDLASTHSLRLRVKGNRAWAWLDGARIAGPLPLTATTVRGRTGAGSQGGASRLSAFRAEPMAATFAIADRFASLPAAQRSAATAFLPTWRAAQNDGALDEELRRDLLEAAAVGVEVIPRIAPRSDLAPREARLLAHEVARTLAGPVAGRLVNRIAIRDSSGRIKTALREWDYAIVHIATLQEALALVKAAELRPDDLLLIEDAGSGIEAGVEALLHHIPPARVITPGGVRGTGRVLDSAGSAALETDS